MTPPDASSGPDDHLDPELAELVSEFAAYPPPPPCETTWKRVQGEIAARLIPPHPAGARRVRWARSVAAVGGLAAAVTAGFLAWPPATPPADPLAGYEVLPIATPSDVFVSAVRHDPDLMLIACDHPLPGKMRLASVRELEVYRPQDLALSVPTPDDAPILIMDQDK